MEVSKADAKFVLSRLKLLREVPALFYWQLDIGRVCIDCGKFKLWECYRKRKDGKNGRTPACRLCMALRERRYSSKPRAFALLQERRKRRANTERYKEHQKTYGKRYRAIHRDYYQEYNKKWRANHPDYQADRRKTAPKTTRENRGDIVSSS